MSCSQPKRKHVLEIWRNKPLKKTTTTAILNNKETEFTVELKERNRLKKEWEEKVPWVIYVLSVEAAESRSDSA